MAGVNDNIASDLDVRVDRIHSGHDLLLWRTRPAVLGGRLGQAGALCKDGPTVCSDTVIMRTSRPRLLWAAWKATGELAWSRAFSQVSPASAMDDLVFVSADRQLWCLDASTGHARWKTVADDDVVGRPTVSAGQVFWSSSGGSLPALTPGQGVSSGARNVATGYSLGCPLSKERWSGLKRSLR
jgi:outer membrane protein assembly factor BamB